MTDTYGMGAVVSGAPIPLTLESAMFPYLFPNGVGFYQKPT
jgi:hypothetical protein